MNVCVTKVCSAYGSQEGVSEPLEVELQMVVSHRVVTGEFKS